jgi:hypothetical protein
MIIEKSTYDSAVSLQKGQMAQVDGSLFIKDHEGDLYVRDHNSQWQPTERSRNGVTPPPPVQNTAAFQRAQRDAQIRSASAESVSIANARNVIQENLNKRMERIRSEHPNATQDELAHYINSDHQVFFMRNSIAQHNGRLRTLSDFLNQ